MKRKLLSVLLALTLLSAFQISAYGLTNGNTGDYVWVNGEPILLDDLPSVNEGEFQIVPSLQRINNNGTFTFDVGWSLVSNKFKFSSTSTTINVCAIIKNSIGANVTSQYPNHRYQIILYKDTLLGTTIADAFFYANGTTYSWSISGVNTTDTYYIKIINTDYLPTGTTVVGDGSISNYVAI